MRKWLLSLMLLSGCTAPIQERESYLVPYRRGEVQEAALKSDELIDKRLGQRGFVASKNASWMLLDSGVCHLAANTGHGQKRFETALEAIDFYSQSLARETAAAIATEDAARAYAPPPFEQILSRLYFALALMQQGDFENSFAMLRQAETKTEELSELQSAKVSPSGSARYLLSLFLRRAGDWSNADLIEQRADTCSVQPLRLPKHPNLIVMHHIGLAPERVSRVLPESQIAGYVIEDLVDKPAISSIAGIAVPELIYGWDIHRVPSQVTIDRKAYPLRVTDDIGQMAQESLSDEMPYIVTRAVTRLLLRRGTVAAAQKSDEGLGIFTDLAMLAANIATKADTRSWGTLPEQIRMGVFELKSGEHTLNFPGFEPITIHLTSGDLAVIHHFQPQKPGVIR